jgi:hypothetical protein
MVQNTCKRVFRPSEVHSLGSSGPAVELASLYLEAVFEEPFAVG